MLYIYVRFWSIFDIYMGDYCPIECLVRILAKMKCRQDLYRV